MKFGIYLFILMSACSMFHVVYCACLSSLIYFHVCDCAACDEQKARY